MKAGRGHALGRAWLAPGLYACLILAATSVPAQHLEFVADIEMSDRWAHLLLYIPLGLLVFGALGRSRPNLSLARRSLAALMLCIAFGALDELHQLLIPGRFCDVGDVLADAVGAALGVALGLALVRVRRQQRERRAMQRPV